MKHRIPRPFVGSLLVAFALLHGQAADRFVWVDGHGDLGVGYSDGAWSWHAHQAKPVDQVIIRLEDVARNEIPANPAFEFLGEPGDPIWIIPAGQKSGVPFLGMSSEASTRTGTFLEDRFDLALGSVRGTGNFILWTIGGTGLPRMLMNSGDGIDARDSTPVPAPGHFHPNWGFTAPGTYWIGFRAAGTLAEGNTRTESDEMIYTYEVNVLKEGEVDLEVALEDGALTFHVHDHATDASHAPEHVALQAGPATRQTVPAGAGFRFLGPSGAPVFVLPGEAIKGTLALGLAVDVDAGVLAEEQVAIRLMDVEGPGAASYFEVDGFGEPTVWFNSSDGIDATDTIRARAGSHAHRNWAFTVPGVYRLTLQAEAVLAGGGTISSQPTVFIFEVVAPTMIAEGEVELQTTFAEGEFRLRLREDATERHHFFDETILVAGPAAQTVVPEKPGFSFLGSAGARLFVLPAEPVEGLVFPGLAVEGIEAGTFVGETVRLELASLDGPGILGLYDTGTFGEPIVFWNSGDGVDAADVFPTAIGTHTHLNWAFTEPGLYRIGVRASGILAAGNTVVRSNVATVTVQIEPVGPVLTATRLNNGAQVRIDWLTERNRLYQLQSRTSLVGADWTDTGRIVEGSGNVESVTLDSANEPFRIFRVVTTGNR